MIITRHGETFFKIQLGDLTVAVNPPSKSSKKKASRFGADIVLENIRHEDFSGGDEMNLGGKIPFVINGPGEYEVKSVFVQGVPGETNYDNKKLINTIYTITIDGIKMCMLGYQSNKSLTAESKNVISDIDLLFIGVGGDVISPSEAYKLAVSMEPKAIVPFSENDADIKAFLKEAGSTPKPEDKLTLKRKDIDTMDGDILLVSIS